MKYANEELKMRALAKRLESFWRQRGYVVNAWVEMMFVAPCARHTAGTHWVVRSDMVNGSPIRRL